MTGIDVAHPADEVAATVAEYVALRARIEAGEATWTDLARFFTDDVVYIDPAWGRVEGIDEIRAFLDESMRGLEDWRFPIELTAIDGDDVVIRWDAGAAVGQVPVGHVDPPLRRRREVRLRGGPPQHGPRPRGPPGRRLASRPGVPTPTRHPEPQLLPPLGPRADPRVAPIPAIVMQIGAGLYERRRRMAIAAATTQAAPTAATTAGPLRPVSSSVMTAVVGAATARVVVVAVVDVVVAVVDVVVVVSSDDVVVSGTAVVVVGAAVVDVVVATAPTRRAETSRARLPSAMRA